MVTGERWFVAICAALVLSVPVGPAAANDSGSELAAGGLVLVKTDSIAMQREDLTLSPSEVRVRYEMRNDTGKPVTLRVAFPLPEVPKDTPGGMETSGGHNINLERPSDPNFLGFRITADGQAVAPEVEIRATLPDGRDITDAVRAAGGTKLLLQPRVFELTAGADWDLDAPARKQLQDLGALTQESDAYDLLWTTRITFHWMQVFHPGVTVIEHSYRPILGFQLFAAERDGHPDPDKAPWKASGDENLVPAYCIDSGTDRAMRTVYKRLVAKRHDPNDAYFPAYTLGYILQTAKNWHGPIGTFHLTLQGGHINIPHALEGDARVLSLCTDLPLRQTAPLHFEATVRNYVPSADLRVLIVPE
jgi:Domain of unknown function (DUF4424)